MENLRNLVYLEKMEQERRLAAGQRRRAAVWTDCEGWIADADYNAQLGNVYK